MKKLITGPADPNCKWCHGRGVTGGCETREHEYNPDHAHTMMFCECVEEHYVEE